MSYLGEHEQRVDLFLIDNLGDFINRATDADYMSGGIKTARQIIARVVEDKMLDKEQAKWLERYVDEQILHWMHESLHADKLGRLYGIATQLEEKAIYSEVWNKYCRPGTYHI